MADVAIGPRELSAAPVEWFQTWSSVYVQTLMLFPYPVHALQTSGESVYVAHVGVGHRID